MYLALWFFWCWPLWDELQPPDPTPGQGSLEAAGQGEHQSPTHAPLGLAVKHRTAPGPEAAPHQSLHSLATLLFDASLPAHCFSCLLLAGL